MARPRWRGASGGRSSSPRATRPGPRQTAGDRDNGFIDGRYGLQWKGDWAAATAMDALGDDVLFLPAPDFGSGPKIGAGSWQWSISDTCDQPEGANAFIDFVSQPQQIAEFAESRTGIPPAATRPSATTKWAEGAPLAVFQDYTAAEG